MLLNKKCVLVSFALFVILYISREISMEDNQNGTANMLNSLEGMLEYII